MIRLETKKSLFLLFLLTLAMGRATQAQGTDYYVSPTGSDGNAGSKEQPFATLERGQAAAQAGDTVFLRGGSYDFNSPSAEIGLRLFKNGQPGKPIHYLAYQGEIPVFDFKNMTAAKRIKGVVVEADWIYLKGIEMKNVPQTASLKAKEDWCLKVVGGSNNVFESLNVHDNMGPGIFVEEGGNNLFLNCDSHDNFDAYSWAPDSNNIKVPAPGENGDGFGVHVTLAASKGNRFYGCRAWWNADDGWDFINCVTSVTVEKCWSWGNGYKPGSNPPEIAGNGNGFKVGGFGSNAENAPNQVPQHMVRYCLAFDNRSAGFYQNHHPIANFYYNNTAFNNKSSNFNLLGYKGGKASLGILRNNIAYTGVALGNAKFGNLPDDANNTWDMPSITVTDEDFRSVDTAGVGAHRKADGGLPDIAFMKIMRGSDLIGRGVETDASHTGGPRPDMGAFSYEGSDAVIGKADPLAKANRTLGITVWDDRDLIGRIHRSGRTGTRLPRP